MMTTLNDIRNQIRNRRGYLSHLEHFDPVDENNVIVTFEIFQTTRTTRFIVDYLVVFVKNFGKENEEAYLSENIDIDYVLTPGKRGKYRERPEEKSGVVSFILA